jgi:aryl-alcohol dehydrogenase-like predicted oxidoreductase
MAMIDYRRAVLGRTGLAVGRLGVACSYGAPTEAFEEAFEQGINYFYWGSTRKAAMARAIRNIMAKGKRDHLVIVIQSYSRSAVLMETFYRQALKTLNIETADILLLGWHNRPPSPNILDRALKMKEKGMFRFLAVSGHHRPMFANLARDAAYDLFHVRYNAAHRGAESDVFSRLPDDKRPGIVTYTATRWSDLLNAKKMPPGEKPLSGSDCYRFVLSNPAVNVCMTGPKNMVQMREALKALDLGPLSEQEMVRFRKIGDFVHDHHKRLFA